ncbi:MAG: hybrid sensor histidine kinase/response regulator [Synechococcaceae cyanobacterium RM1_1_27]|nr:hybrid sensor histidine kinase/response regulator [Synechococcaceae cyanobacterium RM1_1_27]
MRMRTLTKRMAIGAGDNFEPRLDHLASLFDSSDDMDPSMDSTIPASAVVGHPVSDSAEGLELDLDKELEAILGDLDLDLDAPAPAVSVKPAVVAPTAPAPATTRRSTNFSNQTMRVEVRHLDQINNLVGEMVVNRNSMEQNHVRLRQFLDGLLGRVQQLSDLGQQMQDQYDRSLLETALLSGTTRSSGGYGGNGSSSSGSSFYSTGHQAHGFDALEMDRFSAFHALSQEIIELIVRVRESSSDIEFAVDEAEQVARQFRQVTTQLQEGLNRARMVPFSQIADRLPRAIRDLSIKTGKQATLEVEGRDTSIDKAILEELYDPMTHLVNNALVHGIETPNERKQSGKNPEGKIKIRAFYQGNQSIIIVSDDGGGIPVDKVRNKAVGLSLLESNASEDEVFNVLFHPGFSGRSAEEVDDLAGRGVGLDVVRRNISELRGSIQIDSALGKGTTFTIRLPLTLSISKAMVCVSNKALIAFPLDGVEEMLDVPQDEIITDEQGRPTIPWRDQRLHFQPLSHLLKFSRPHGRRGTEVYSITQDEGIVPIVIIQSSGNYVALQVDSFVEEQEIVIKQLRGPVPKPLGVAGATVLGNGRVLPIADILELVDLAQGRTRRELSRTWEGIDQGTQDEEQEHLTTVLIVDDSITVRELLSMTFQKVGYRVEQARDGQDAWEKLRGGLPCDIIFCDIEMPRMDGLELLSRLQKDSQLQSLPVAMLTSRGADRHRQMAVDLGAKGYFTKPYLEEMLLDAAKRMLDGENIMGAMVAPAKPQET